MFPYEKYPYTNFHDLNLGYFLTHFREIFSQWASLYEEMQSWKTATEQELEDWKTTVLDDINAWETALTGTLDQWEADVMAGLETWKTAFQTLFDDTFSDLEEIKTDAEAARDAALAAQTAAEAAATAAAQSAATFTTDTTLTIAGRAADAKATGDRVDDIIDRLFAYRDISGADLTWTYSTLINPSNGQPVTSPDQITFATSDYFDLEENSTNVRYTGPRTDENDVDYVVIFSFYTDSGWTGDRINGSDGQSISVPVIATRCRISFGRTTSTAIECTSADTALFEMRDFYKSYDVDPTLTIAGAAADAKVTGDWVFNAPTLRAGNSTRIRGNSNLNDYTTPGNFHVLNTTDAGNIQNMPISAQGRLFVIATLGGNYLAQIFVPVTMSKYGYFVRYTTSGNIGSAVWRVVNPVNYPVRNMTDATSYINNTLSTGRCILESGTYYVTGIVMPNNSELIGRGPATRIVLLDSVTTGYAVKMGKNCVISNLTISGSDTDLTFTEGDAASIHLGNRHGILYLGTATESSSENSVTPEVLLLS